MNARRKIAKVTTALILVFSPLISTAKIISEKEIIYREFSGRGTAVEEFDSGEGLWAARNDLEGVSASVNGSELNVSYTGNGTYFIPNSKDMSLDRSVRSSATFELTANVLRDFMLDNLETLNKLRGAPNRKLEGMEFRPYGVYWGYRDDQNYQMVLIKGYLFSLGKVENGTWTGTNWMPAFTERVEQKYKQLYVDERSRALMFSTLKAAEMSVFETYMRLASKASASGSTDPTKILNRLGYSKEEEDNFYNITKVHAPVLWGDTNKIRVLQKEGQLKIFLNEQQIYSSSDSAYIGELGHFGVMMQKSGNLTIDRFAVESWGEPASMALAEAALQAGDAARALTHIRPLAEKGNDAFAQARLGQMYLEGIGLTRDFEQGLSWLQKSAAQGDDTGQVTLGMVLATGPVEMQDFPAARSWLLKGMQGVTTQPTLHQRNAAYLLGTMFASGNGGSQDYQEAKRWLELAAGPPEPLRMALSALGEFSLNGYDGNQDVEKARQLFLRAIQLGEPAAAIHLGVMYGNGTGVKQNIMESYKWCWIGFQSSPPGPIKDSAKNLLTQLEVALTPDQRKTAENAAVEWMREQLDSN